MWYLTKVMFVCVCVSAICVCTCVYMFMYVCSMCVCLYVHLCVFVYKVSAYLLIAIFHNFISFLFPSGHVIHQIHPEIQDGRVMSLQTGL